MKRDEGEVLSSGISAGAENAAAADGPVSAARRA